MKKVLICMTSFSLSNGISSFILNQYHLINKKKYKIDFLLTLEGISNIENLNKVKQCGSQIFELRKSNKLNRYKKTYKEAIRIIKKNKYDIVHVNLLDFYAAACINAAKKLQVPSIIYHVHNPKVKSNFSFFRNMLNYCCIKNSTHLCSCTEEAGKSMFQKHEYSVVNNLINLEKYSFDINERKRIRNELLVTESDLLIGVVGRITGQKNPQRVLEIFEKVKAKKTNAKLIWIGKGEKYEELEKSIEDAGLAEDFLLLGEKENVNSYYSAMDVFFLPSVYEGLGIVFIEAQASGLNVITSNKVPKRVKETELVKFIDLEENSNKWADEIISLKREKDRLRFNKYMSDNSIFSIKNENEQLEKFYEKL